MSRKCIACGRRPADTLPEYPALCLTCLDRAGERIQPAARVVCHVDESCSGTVKQMDGDLAVVTTNDGEDAWLPRQELIRVRKR